MKSVNEGKKLRMERYFYNVEVLHYYLYTSLSARERNRGLKKILNDLAKGEKGHIAAWRGALLEHGVAEPGNPPLMGLQILFFQVIRNILGVAFVTRLIEKDEARVLEDYIKSLKSVNFSAKEKRVISEIIEDERTHESELADEMKIYEHEVNYVRSVVYGLNDGLVEVLAAVAGLAVIATSPMIVVIGGVIIGVSGTLSMAGGAYLSSKSDVLLGPGDGKTRPKPSKEALYTGVYYLLGALTAVAPFALGLEGFSGIVAAIVLVVIVLALSSGIIAVISSTSIKRRITETIAISIGASLATIALGLIMRVYFGVSI